jgi:hypothetical protein
MSSRSKFPCVTFHALLDVSAATTCHASVVVIIIVVRRFRVGDEGITRRKILNETCLWHDVRRCSLSLAWSAATTTLGLVVVLIVSLVLLALLLRLIRALMKCIVAFLGSVIIAAAGRLLLHVVAVTSAGSTRTCYCCLAVSWMLTAAAVHGRNNVSNAHLLRERIIACNLQPEDPFYP